MKSKKVGRKAKDGIPIHPLLRISPEGREIHVRYTPEERSEIYDRALSTIFPRSVSAKTLPVLIRPSKTLTDTICRVVLVGRWVRLFFAEKRDDFRGLVKKFLYSWEGCWEREFAESVDIIDRAAEISNELLLAGFWIQVDNESIKDRIVSQSFVPEAFKTIKRCTKGVYKDCFVFNWPRSDDYYAEAMKLTAARYSDGSIYVPSEHFAEVEDFAEVNDFMMSEAAVSLAAEAKAAKEAAIIVNPKRKVKKTPKRDKNSSATIPAHLRDDFDD